MTSWSRGIVKGFPILRHLKYRLNKGPVHHCSSCLFPCLLPTVPHIPRIPSPPGAEADTYCRTFRLVMWSRQKASFAAVLSPKPFLDSLEEAEMKCYWQREPHSSPGHHPQVPVTPVPHPHVHRTVPREANARDSKDTEGGRKEQGGFVILQQKLKREVKLTWASQEHTDLPSWLSCPGLELNWNCTF